jgi:hypothetical protein
MEVHRFGMAKRGDFLYLRKCSVAKPNRDIGTITNANCDFIAITDANIYTRFFNNTGRSTQRQVRGRTRSIQASRHEAAAVELQWVGSAELRPGSDVRRHLPHQKHQFRPLCERQRRKLRQQRGNHPMGLRRLREREGHAHPGCLGQLLAQVPQQRQVPGCRGHEYRGWSEADPIYLQRQREPEVQVEAAVS